MEQTLADTRHERESSCDATEQYQLRFRLDKLVVSGHQRLPEGALRNVLRRAAHKQRKRRR